MVNDLKDKLQHTNPLETSINGRQEIENVLSKFPVTDEIALNKITFKKRIHLKKPKKSHCCIVDFVIFVQLNIKIY